MTTRLSTIGPGGGGSRLLDRQVFTSSGTWTKPATGAGNVAGGVGRSVYLSVIGGGAGGQNFGTVPSGGGRGGVTRLSLPISVLGATETVTVGAAGAANSNGGSSRFGGHAYAGGGLAGQSTNQRAGVGNTSFSGVTLGANGGGVGDGGNGGGNSNDASTGVDSPEAGAGGAEGASGGGAGGAGVNSSSHGLGSGGGGAVGAFAGGAGGLYGAGGGGGATAGLGAQGVVVVEVWG